MVNLDYFYGSEGEQYRFYQIPAILLEDEEYKKISDTAKLLYGILLSRLALSKKNNWIEKETNRVYILYNRNDIAKKMGKCPATISNAMNQLLEVGLIKRKRQGQGKADMLYVMNFSSGEHKKTVNIQCEERKEVPASPDQPHSFYEDREEKVYTNDGDMPSLQNKRAAYREIIKKQIDYDVLRQSPYDMNIIDNIVEVMPSAIAIMMVPMMIVHTICEELKYGASSLLAPSSTAITDIPEKNSVRYKNNLFFKMPRFFLSMSTPFLFYLFAAIMPAKE